MTENRLTVEEARELLPLYVARSLTPEQTEAVEASMREYPELRGDLQIWRAISDVSRSRARFESTDHPIPEELLSFAEKIVELDPARRAAIEVHFKACAACRDDVAMMQASLIPDRAVAQASPTSLSPRQFLIWRYAAAAVILLALLGSLLTLSQKRESDEGGESVTLNLPFLESYRSPGDANLPIPHMEITKQARSVVLQVEVPLPLTRLNQLAWSMRSPTQAWVNLENPIRTEADSTGYAIVWLELPGSRFSGDGAYALKAISSHDDEFVYEFVVTRR